MSALRTENCQPLLDLKGDFAGSQARNAQMSRSKATTVAKLAAARRGRKSHAE
jgi:hypothetical protein